MKILLVSIFLISVSLTFTFAQLNQDWVQRYNGSANDDDIPYAMVIGNSGNIYVTGSAKNSGTGSDYVTIVYNSSGIQQWVAIYSGPSSGNYANAIAVDAAGNVYVTGESWGNGTYYDYATVKYNSSGVQQWANRYNGPGNLQDNAVAIAVDASGNVYVTGASYGDGTNYDCTTIKYNASGIQQWVKRYNGSGNSEDAGASIGIDGAGNIYVTGHSYNAAMIPDYLTIRYSPSGVQQWVQKYNGTGDYWDIATSIAVSSNGNVYVTGYSLGSGSHYDYATIMYSTLGVQQWVQRYNGPGNAEDKPNQIAIDPFQNVYVTGYVSTGISSMDCATIKYNTSGIQQWVKLYHDPNNGINNSFSVSFDGSGNVYIAGYGFVGGTNYDYLLIKYNSSGIQQWVQRYDGPSNGFDAAYAMDVDASGNIYVTGESTGNNTKKDYCTIKYSQQIGIKKISSEIPEKYNLSQNYPNPFNPTTRIKFEIPVSPLRERGAGGFTSLIIYDMLGREAATLVDQQLAPGIYEVQFDGTNYHSGVYYYRLNADGYSITKKLVLLK